MQIRPTTRYTCADLLHLRYTQGKCTLPRSVVITMKDLNIFHFRGRRGGSRWKDRRSRCTVRRSRYTVIPTDSLSYTTTSDDSINITNHNSIPPVDLPSACSPPHRPNPPSYEQNSSSYENLSVLVINCRSIRNKCIEFWNILRTSKPSIVILTETWLNPSIYNHEIFPPELDFRGV